MLCIVMWDVHKFIGHCLIPLHLSNYHYLYLDWRLQGDGNGLENLRNRRGTQHGVKREPQPGHVFLR